MNIRVKTEFIISVNPDHYDEKINKSPTDIARFDLENDYITFFEQAYLDDSLVLTAEEV